MTNPVLATDFLIDFCNKAGEAYVNSYLNKDYEECRKIIIHVEEQEIEQAASDRLWKTYRGTHVGPNLLISLLMGFERWLLAIGYTDAVKPRSPEYSFRGKEVLIG